MKKLLLLGALGYAAFLFGKHVAMRDSTAPSRRRLRGMDDVADIDTDEAQEALAEAMRFEARQVALADLALERSPAGALRSVATMMLEEHNSGLERARMLQADDVADLEPADDQPAMARLQALDEAEFEQAWIATVTQDHNHMLESLDDVLLPSGDARVDDHLRDVRDHVQAHLQHLLALQGDDLRVA